MRLTIFTVCTFLFLGRCAEIKNVNRPDLIKLNKENFREFKGEYNNIADSIEYIKDVGSSGSYIAEYTSLWGMANLHDKDFKTHPNWEKQTVKVYISEKNKMCFQLFEDGKFISEKIIKGKIANGYFYENQHGYIVPFIPVWFGHDFDRKRIGFKENEILIDASETYWMFALMGGNTYITQRVIFYKKIETK